MLNCFCYVTFSWSRARAYRAGGLQRRVQGRDGEDVPAQGMAVPRRSGVDEWIEDSRRGYQGMVVPDGLTIRGEEQ